MSTSHKLQTRKKTWIFAEGTGVEFCGGYCCTVCAVFFKSECSGGGSTTVDQMISSNRTFSSRMTDLSNFSVICVNCSVVQKGVGVRMSCRNFCKPINRV